MGTRLGMFAARDLSGIQESPLDIILGAGAPRYPMDERPPSPAPVQIGGAKGGGFFAPGGTGRAIVGNIGDALLRLSGGAPAYGPAMQHQRDFQDRLKLAEMQRQQAMQDWQTKYNYEIANPKPSTAQPYRFEDNAGNVWQVGATGQPERIFTDTVPKMYIQGDQAIQIPNPFAANAPETISEDLWNTGKPVGGAATSGTPPFGVSGQTLDNITMMAESGGDPNAVSPAGARGLMQVMPSTARDPGFGIRPSNGTPADDVRVGREYRRAMQRRYGGDPAKMWAAYNAGPDTVDRALSSGPDWLTRLPAETQNYVTRNLRALRGR